MVLNFGKSVAVRPSNLLLSLTFHWVPPCYLPPHLGASPPGHPHICTPQCLELLTPCPPASCAPLLPALSPSVPPLFLLPPLVPWYHLPSSWKVLHLYCIHLQYSHTGFFIAAAGSLATTCCMPYLMLGPLVQMLKNLLLHWFPCHLLSPSLHIGSLVAAAMSIPTACRLTGRHVPGHSQHHAA